MAGVSRRYVSGARTHVCSVGDSGIPKVPPFTGNGYGPIFLGSLVLRSDVVLRT